MERVLKKTGRKRGREREKESKEEGIKKVERRTADDFSFRFFPAIDQRKL